MPLMSFKVYLISGHVAHVDDASQNGQALLGHTRPLKASKVSTTGGAVVCEGALWIPMSAVAWVEQV